MDKKKRIYKITKKSLIILIFVSLLLTMSFIGNSVINDVSLKASDRIYAPLQYEIDKVDTKASDYVDMSTLYTASGSSVTSKNITLQNNNIVLITTAYDLYAFSVLSNIDNSPFLGYHYELSSNINYDDCNYPFYPVAWNSTYNDRFTGIFDGNGFEIRNLEILQITEDNGATYESMEYYAMFSYNNGTVTNLGLVNAALVTNTSSLASLLGVAPLVGLNMGTISYCYAKDLRDPVTDEEAGIVTAGGFQISGLVSDNEGTFTDSYVAYNIVCNYSITDYIDFSEILTASNEGAINSNLYFYNASIDEYTLSGNRETVAYDRNLVGKTLTRNHYGATYIESIEALNTVIENNNTSNKWYTEKYYQDCTTRVKDSFLIDTPILRGLSYTVSDNITVFNIETLRDFLYAFEIMNDNAVFTSDGCKYLLKTDIDLSSIPQELYSYDNAFNATFEGSKISEENKTITVTDVKNISSEYPTIYNAKIDNTVTIEGIECYGFLPWLTGTIKNINFYYTDSINYIDNTANISKKAIGLVSGYIEGGELINVNAYGNIAIDKNIGRYAMGGLCGILTDKGNILSSTVSGSINAGNNQTAYTSLIESGYVPGNCLGGVVGFTTYTAGDLNKVLSAVNLTATTFSSSSTLYQHIGGVVGAGYTQVAVDLTNKGSITIGSSSNNNIGRVYAAGVIGRHLGIGNQIEVLYNQGDITIYSSTNEAYVSGVSNVELVSTSDTLQASRLRNTNGKIAYLATSLTNASTFNIYNNSNSVNFAGVLNINSSDANKFISEINGVYNLAYKYNIDEKVLINPQTINMSNVDKYAPCIVSTAESNDNSAKIEKVYNFKNISFSTTSEVTASEILYSGCLLGKYMNLKDARNEGDLTFSPTHQIGSTSANTLTRIVGVFEEVTGGYKANQIYNGGNIALNAANYVYGDIYINGICNYNRNGFTDAELRSFNPTEASFDDSKEGSLNQVINNGDITCTNTSFTRISYSEEKKLSLNGYQTIASIWHPSTASSYFVGNINASGIAYINESVITNTFNLGDVLASNYIVSSTNIYSVNASGISTLNIGGYAYILNSANNGIIRAMNISESAFSNVNASGISVRNDKLENGADYTGGTNNSRQMICFTINYGSIYSYNYCENIRSSADEARTKSAGILAMGLCNIINTVNYGNVYGSETASGIFGIVYFQKYTSEVSESNKIYIANSINYGNVRVLEKGTNHFTDASCSHIPYTKFIILSDNDADIDNYAKLEIILEEGKNYFIGSIFALVNFNNDTNANNVSIRFLISFLENVKLVGAEASTPASVTVDVNNIYSAYYKFANNEHNYDDYMGQKVVYSPLSTTAVGSDYGVFSENFAFRKAIEKGEGLSSANVTDKFLSDYFQFVAYTKINDNLLDKIGWRTIAYYTAANDFARNLDQVMKFLDTYMTKQGNSYSSLVTSALNTSNWVQYCSNEMLLRLIDDLFATYSVEELQTLFSYLFSSACENSVLITNSVRADIVEKILEVDSEVFSKVNFISYTNGYSTLLANALSVNFTNEVKEYVDNYFNNPDNNISDATLKIILESYISILRNDNNTYFADMSSSERYDVLSSLFNAIDSDIFYEGLFRLLSTESQNTISSLSISSSANSEIGQYSAYASLSDSEKVAFYKNIIINNSPANIDTYLGVMSDDIEMYSYLKENGYDLLSFEEILSSTSMTATSEDELIKSERVALYNQIKGTDVFKSYLTSMLTSTYYALATEHRNTYQSTIAPSNQGAFSGDLAYVYDKNVTPSTYFYGPYSSSTGGGAPTSLTANPNINLSLGNQSSGTYSVFMSKDKDLMDQYLQEGLINQYYVFYYEHKAEGANNQLCGEQQFTESHIYLRRDGIDSEGYYPSDFSGCELNIVEGGLMLTDSAGVTFDASGGSVSAFKHKRTSAGSINAATELTVTGKYIVTDANNVAHEFTDRTVREWSELIQEYTVKYYVAIPTTALHSTKYTGIYCYAQPWTSVAPYFTWKTSNTKVYTSQYIDYSVDDLVKLDGVLTAYDNTTLSSDERNIINDLFNKYFVTDSTVFQRIVKQALLESLSYDKLQNPNVNYIDNFMKTNIYSAKRIGNQKPFEYLNFTGSTSVQSYLLSQSANLGYKDKILLATSLNIDVYTDLVDNVLNATEVSYDTSGSPTQAEREKLIEAGLISEVDNGSDTDVSTDYGINVINTLNSASYSGVNYTQGLKFGTINLPSVTQNSVALNIIAKSTGASSTLTISSGGTNLGTITIGAMNRYTFDISNYDYTSYTLSSAQDVILYDVMVGMQDVPSPITYTVAAGSNSYDTIIPTEAILKQTILNNLNDASLTANNIDISSVNASTNVYNSAWGNNTVNLYIGNTAISTDTTIARRSTATITADVTNYFGQTLTAKPTSGTVSSNIYFTNNITYTVDYAVNTEASLISKEDIALSREKYVTLPTYDSIIKRNTYNLINSSVNNKNFLITNISYLMPMENSNEIITGILTSEEFLKSLACFSNDNTMMMINEVTDKTILVDIMKLLVNDNYRLFNSIIDNQKENLTDAFKEELVAAYIATDYSRIYNQSLTNPNVNVSSTIMKTLLDVFDSDRRYITANGTFNNNYFDNLLREIDLSLATSGYGIYALSSSKGILNGQFIPDNIGLSSMDTNYDYDNRGFITLTAVTDRLPYWRGGSVSTEALDGSVSDGFLNDMKQLKLSISTTIFDLDLSSGSDTLYSSSELIDLDNATITYYVPTGYNGHTFVYDFASIANGAIINYDGFSITASSTALNGVSDTLVVTAEDRTIQKEYTVTIICIDMDYSIGLTGSPVSSGGGELALAISPNAGNKLPQGLDLAPYITIQKEDGTIMEGTFTIASNATVDANGYAEVMLNVNTTLSYGTYNVVISLFGIDTLTKSVEFEKDPSTECLITAFEYEGYEVEFDSNNEATSYVDFGRCFTKDELENAEYLTYISYSDCATSTVTATYETVNSITTYTVVYVVTAENGNQNTYTHYIIERTPNTLPTVYQDGMLVNGASDNNNVVNLAFNRGEEPDYRIKYNLNNFYDNGLNVEYSYNIDTLETSGITASATFAGISVSITSLAEPGTYTFNYVYRDSIYWDNETLFEKEYVFPNVVITKNYSQDALLKTITFLDTNVVLANLTTVMYPNYAIISEEAASGTIDSVNEKDYYSIRAEETPLINVGVKAINYNNHGVDYSSSTNFYAIGSISNAQLSNYAPTFSIEEHAEVYQYTTLKKLRGYGSGMNQSVFDTEILNTAKDEDLYLYVPFTATVNGVEIVRNFVVMVHNGVWGNVYLEKFTGEEAAIATYTKDTSSFVYESITYTKSEYAGNVDTLNNESLYMDYIGTPLENHFWYVSYAVFSEDYIKNYSENSTVKFFHVSIVDATNTIYFEITINAPEALGAGDIYLLIVDRKYNFAETPYLYEKTEYISAFAVKSETVNGITTYLLETNLQTVPRGYFYFYLDLPAGYACTYEVTNGRNNVNNLEEELGGYLPPSSLVTQRVEITFNVFTAPTGVIWGVSTAETYGVQATEVTK